MTRLRYSQRIALAGALFTLPAVLFFAAFDFYPMAQALFMSLTNWNILQAPRFVGLTNYANLLSNEVFRRSLNVTLVYVAATCGATLPLALAVAVLLRSVRRLRSFFEVAYFLPTVISLVVVSVLWKFLLQRLGLVNMILSRAGIEPLPWLTASVLAQATMVIVTVWRFLGYFIVLLSAGLAGIPRECEEAAELDGASPLQALWKVTLPLLKPVTLLVTVVSVITAVQMFIPQYVITRGGPADDTRVLVLLIYETAFRYLRMGEAAAMSFVLLLILLAASLVQFRLFGRSEAA
jgi:multiple sugar transport system permease protein